MSQNPNLIQLGLENNLLTTLDVSENLVLTGIFAASNLLTSIDVSHNLLLNSLWLKNNQIETMDVSLNNSLTSLSLEGNEISALDLSNNNQLTLLRCSENNLEILNIKNGNSIGITELDAQNNPNLECIQVDAGVPGNIPGSWQVDPGTTFSEDCMYLGTDEINLTNLISVYPNPTASQLTIDIPGNIEFKNIFVSNLWGQLIKTKIVQNSVDVSALKSGLYFITIETKEGRIIKKFIKE